MLKIIYLCVFSLATVLVSGDLSILHHPESLEFIENTEDKISPNLLIDIITGVIGYTPTLFQEWNGIKVKDVFDLPKAVVNIVVEGVSSLEMENGLEMISYPLNFAKDEEEIWQGISYHLINRENSSHVRIHAADGFQALETSSLGQLTRQPLELLNSKEHEKEEVFLEEIQILQAITKSISNMTTNQQFDIYWLVVSNLKPFLDDHKGDASSKKALALFRDTISKLAQTFINFFDRKVLVTLIANKYQDPSNIQTSRVRRQAEGSTTEKTSEADSGSTSPLKVDEINLAPKYSKDYPAIFNIILWFGVLMVFSLIAICVAIADMDPGRDSIIYRMTSNRMKKDN